MTPAIATDTAFYVTFTCAVIPLSGGLAVGWTANHKQDIARSWHDGVEQLGLWRDQIAVTAEPAARNFVLWLLGLLLPGRGQHRAGVAS